ncbi:IclR family transcriptional regulator [Streptomyces sp. NPDC001288]|uniref:IclR family transcriptional regulator n=1 Tax=unclassified Streptomyces TaxID=2593676 RepID=UPI00332BB188
MTIPMLPPADDQGHRGPGAAEKVLVLLECVAELTASGAHPTLACIARSSGLAKSTAHRLLSLLVARRLIESAGGGYRRGPVLSALAGRPPGLPADRLRSVLLPYMVDLYELTHETVSLAVVSGTDIVLIERVQGQRNQRSRLSVPDRAPVHGTALGRAILAARAPHLSRDTARPHAVRPPRARSRTDALLAAVRRQGISVNAEGVVPGATCLALPVLDESRRPVAALSLTGLTHTMDIAAAVTHLRAVSRAAGLRVLAEGLR